MKALWRGSGGRVTALARVPSNLYALTSTLDTAGQTCSIHTSSVLLARRKRGSRGQPAEGQVIASGVVPPPRRLQDIPEDELNVFKKWVEDVEQKTESRRRERRKQKVEDFTPLPEVDSKYRKGLKDPEPAQVTNDVFDEVDPEALKEFDETDIDDEETEEFMEEVDNLFALTPEEFEKRMEKMDEKPTPAHKRSAESADADDDEDEDQEDDDEQPILQSERATRMMNKKALLNALDGGHKRADQSLVTKADSKAKAPLTKKTNAGRKEKASFRQDRIETSVQHFTQSLFLQDAYRKSLDIIPNVLEVTATGDLRRIVVYWEPMRLGSTDQDVGKRKVEAVRKNLQNQQPWLQRRITRHLNLKFGPTVEFRRRKENKADDARSMFDEEMEWLDRF